MNVSFTWELDNGDPLPNDERYLGKDTDTLAIIDVRESDEGSYRCTVTNPADRVTSDTVYLDVCE